MDSMTDLSRRRLLKVAGLGGLALGAGSVLAACGGGSSSAGGGKHAILAVYLAGSGRSRLSLQCAIA